MTSRPQLSHKVAGSDDEFAVTTHQMLAAGDPNAPISKLVAKRERSPPKPANE
jgi:hypothetical protein